MNYTNFVAHHETADGVPAEYFFERIRNWRNTELAATDWTQLTDSSVSKTVWATYRQQLRDLPAQNADPKKLKFPTQPNP
jgi:hypothetical protein